MLLLSACQPAASTVKESNGAIQITDFANREVSFNEPPQKVAALGSGDVAIMSSFGITVVGKPTLTGSEEEEGNLKEVQEVGTTHEINYEQIALLQPNVVIGNVAFNQDDVASIENVGAKVVLTEANSIQDIKKQITLYGEMLQQESKAIQINQDLDSKLEEIKTTLTRSEKRVLIVYGAPGTYMAALPNSLSGDILTTAGGVNIAGDYAALENFPQYAQINTERVVEANPDAVLLITHGNPEEIKKGFLKEMEQSSSWNSLKAVKEGRVEVLPSKLFGSNPGTNVTEAVSYMVELLNNME
ncbi:ABC transporter substrate-binding protein [Bacillus sp. B1-b2]|nr:ABC transporter substrate-binding protein [Bacillus sp. B1-b2]